jgi:hypothetical protein
MHRRARTLLIEPAISSLGNAAAAGVAASNAVQPAAMDAALAGARRAELLAAAFDGGGRSGARVADTDMGAMDDCFRSPCSQSTHPHLRFRPHTHDARCCITYLTRASAKSREISATRIVSSVRSVRMRTALRPGRRFHRVSTSELTWKAAKGLPYPTTARAVSEAHDQSQQPSLRPLSESHRASSATSLRSPPPSASPFPSNLAHHPWPRRCHRHLASPPHSAGPPPTSKLLQSETSAELLTVVWKPKILTSTLHYSRHCPP